MATAKAIEINKFYQMIEANKFYSIQDLVEISGLSRPAIARYITDGLIPVTLFNMRTYVYGDNLRKYLRGDRKYD